mgnify:CR=1 FL=1
MNNSNNQAIQSESPKFIKANLKISEAAQTMISKVCYSPKLNECVKVKAPDVEILKTYIRISSEWRDSLLCECELWHRLQALVDAYKETLDSLRRCEDAI